MIYGKRGRPLTLTTSNPLILKWLRVQETPYRIQNPIKHCFPRIVRERVKTAHQHQLSRQAKTNNKLTVKEIEKFCVLNTPCENLLKQAITRLNLSARAYHRILKVARTNADLAGAKAIDNKHIAEAIQYLRLDKN